MKSLSPLDSGNAQDGPAEIEYRFERALTIVVPALNESTNIREVVEGLVRVATDCLDRFEIVAINDGSTDDTGEILDELKKDMPELSVVHHAQRQGVGAGFRAGLALATTPFITVVPGDGAYPPENLRTAFKMVGSARHVGSMRMNQLSARGSLRSLVSRVYKFGIGWLLQLPVSDLHSVHIYAVDSLRRSRLTQNGYLYGIEALAAADIDPDDLSETAVTLAPARDRVNRSLHLSTLRDLLSTLGHLSHRLFSGSKARGLLAFLAAYSLVWVLVCLQFSETPHLQDLASRSARPSWPYLAATLAALPAIILLPLTFGLLLLSLFDRRNNIPRPSDDHVLLSMITGAAALIPLGMLLGAAGLLHQILLVPAGLAVVWLGLLRHPGALRSLFDYLLLRGTARSPFAVLTRLALICALLLVLFGKALPVEMRFGDVMQIYYAFLARVKSTGNFWIDPSVPDLSDFLIGRGNGMHLIFAAMFHAYIGGLLAFVYICGILLLVRRIAVLLLDSELGVLADLRQSIWVTSLDLLVLATLMSSLLRVEFAKYHLQLGFFVTAGLYLLVLQLHRRTNVGTKTLFLTASMLAVALPLIFPLNFVYAGIFLCAAAAVGLLYRDWKFVRATVGLGAIAGLACLLSLMINYVHVGIPELYPTSVFARFADAERFGQLSSFEIWRYIYLAQNLNDQAIEVGPKTVERLHAMLFGPSPLLGTSLAEFRVWVLDWIDHRWTWLASDPWFAVACLSPLILITLIVLYKPRAPILLVTIAVLLLTAPAAYIAGQWPSVFVIAAPVSIYATLFAWTAAFIAAVIARPAELDNIRFEADNGMNFVRKVFLALLFVLLGMGLLYLFVPSPSVNRMFRAFAPLQSILVVLCVCVFARFLLNTLSNAIVLAQIAKRSDRYKLANPAQVTACLIICAAVPGVLFGVPAAQLGAGTIVEALSITVHVLIVVLAGASLYGLLWRARMSVRFLLSRWVSRDQRFVSRMVVAVFMLFALIGTKSESDATLHMVEQVGALDSRAINAATGWDFDLCFEMAEVAKGRGRILSVNATERAVPCYAPIGIPRGTFLHHYNSLLAPHYALVLYGSPDEIEKFYRANNVNFFYFDRKERDYIWGHGFSSLFESENLLRRFDVAHATEDYFLLTWRGQGQRPVDLKITDELARLRPIKIKLWAEAQVAYEKLKQELLKNPEAKKN